MTWASRSLGQTVTRTGGFLKRQLWIWPIIAIAVLSVIGFAVRNAIESTMKDTLASQLQTLRKMETSMLVTWFETQLSNAETLANDPQIRKTTERMLSEATAVEVDDRQTAELTLRQELEDELGPGMSSHDYVGYFLVDSSSRIISSSYNELIGRENVPEYEDFLQRALDGKAVISPPFQSLVLMTDKEGKMRTGEPTMFVCAPVRDPNFKVIAALALKIRPENEFTRILQLGQIGESGQTYAFNEEGRMVSNSRFDEELMLLGLLPDEENSRSILKVQLRDPQGDMTDGHHPMVRRSELPLTKMASAAIMGRTEYDVNGYRDFRGVMVVGAWTWLPDYKLGVATEVTMAEAFRPLTILQRTFWALYALLVACSLAIFGFTLVVGRLRRDAQRAAMKAQHLGQYSLEEKIGSGAMGVVYRGCHAMLRRPTAIKMLDVDKVNEGSMQRFEHEVQITCQLNHPNTIAIFDYGRTPEGVFYYAMEYLDGVNLQTLVDDYGPQPEERVVHILLQICGSLYEAHSRGLVHRDIKPANIMLNRRGGEPDVVKVLDFGLVKAMDGDKHVRLTANNSLTGTPLYMSPEAIQAPMTVDACSDIYAVGAVGYFLLTGRPVFQANSLVELCQHHVDSVPVPPSERRGKQVSAEMEVAILACLEKSRAKRPQTARDLAKQLLKSPVAQQWADADGDAWWGRHERGQQDASSVLNLPADSTTMKVFEQTMITDQPTESVLHSSDEDRSSTRGLT